MLRVGCPWRDMHERYGKWNSVYVRFRRWAEQGVWDALPDTLVELGLTDNWQHMIDSTTVRGHSQAAGAKGGIIRRAIARMTPCLLGLFSIVTLLGKQLTLMARWATTTTAWYRKQRPTFLDTLATVRRDIWYEQGFVTSSRAANTRKLRPNLRSGIAYALFQAA